MQPTFYPAETGLGYIGLARKDARDAVTRFERALASAEAYVPALVGRGQALLELGRDGEALTSFETALKADPSLTDISGRVDLLRVRAVQDNLARAKAATDAGRCRRPRPPIPRPLPRRPIRRSSIAISRRSSGRRGSRRRRSKTSPRR